MRECGEGIKNMGLLKKVDYSFTKLNEYIEAERTHRNKAATIKKMETEYARLHFLGIKIQTPCRVKFIWHVENRRRDPDNIAFAKKYILDGMVAAGAIPNDNLCHIIGLQDEFVVDGKDYVEVCVNDD